jgi:hypothetical protein
MTDGRRRRSKNCCAASQDAASDAVQRRDDGHPHSRLRRLTPLLALGDKLNELELSCSFADFSEARRGVPIQHAVFTDEYP